MFTKIMMILAVAALTAVTGSHALAQTSPEHLVRQISTNVIEAARADKAIQAGNMKHILALVESKVMPHVDFEVVTRSAVGPAWREATEPQRSQLQAEFKSMLLRVYSGALSRVREHTVSIVKAAPVSGATQLVVQTEVRGQGQAIKLDYRLDRPSSGATWKIIDVGVGGLWLVQSYRTQFAQEISKNGINGLIAVLAARNQAASQR